MSRFYPCIRQRRYRFLGPYRPECLLLEDRTMLGDAAVGPLVTACFLLPTHDPVAPVENWLGDPFPGRLPGPDAVEVFHGLGQPTAGVPFSPASEDFLLSAAVRSDFVSASPGPFRAEFAANVDAVATPAADSDKNAAPAKDPDADSMPDDPVAAHDPMAAGNHPDTGAGPFRGQVSDNLGGAAAGGSSAPTAAPANLPGDAIYPASPSTAAPGLAGPGPIAPASLPPPPTPAAVSHQARPQPAPAGLAHVATATASDNPTAMGPFLHSPTASGPTTPVPIVASATPASPPATAHTVLNRPAAPPTQHLSFLDPTFSSVEGQSFSGVIGTFFDPTGTSGPDAYSALIDWGDASTSAGTITGLGGADGFQISGTHVYADDGTYNVNITVTGPAGQNLLVNSTSAQVADASLSPQPVIYTAPLGVYSDVVGAFSDSNPGALPQDFVATVAWGDGATSVGVVSGQEGSFAVSGTHTYTVAGAYTIAVSVQDKGGSTTALTSTLYLATLPPAGQNPLLPTDPTIGAVEGAPFSGAVGTFIDTDGNHDPSRYTVQTITWGDNSSSGGSVSGSGPFTVSGSHSYSEEGSYTVTANVHDSDGANFTVVSTAQVTDAAVSIVSTTTPSPTAGTAWSGQLMTFSDADPFAQVSDFKATIAWGDGQSSAGTIGTSGANFTVSGAHTYAQGQNALPINLTVQDGGGSYTAPAISTSVSGVKITVKPNLVVFAAGVATSVNLGSFSDSDGDTNTGDFTVTVDWGDGSALYPPALTPQGNSIQVQGTHTYQDQGLETITINIKDKADPQTAMYQDDALVIDFSYSYIIVIPSTLNTLKYSGTLLTFQESDQDTNPADFQCLTTWAPGSPPVPSPITFTQGTLTVTGNHTYSQAGSYPITNVITNLINGSSITIVTPVQVTPSGALSVTGAANLTGTEAVNLNNLTLATFTDSDNNTSASAYSAGTTIDWGDGSAPTSAAITGSGPFTVAGSHTYADAGIYTIAIDVVDSDGASAIGVPSITIGDATLTSTGQTLSATTGVPLSAVTVATFTDANTSAPLSDFTAQVNWGDNSPVTGATISGGSGSFTVKEGHLYTAAGTYTVTVTITDVDGSTTTATTTVTVTNGSPSLSVSAVSATEGVLYSATVATFTPGAGTGGHTFVATLAWGDGAVTYGTLTSNGLGGYNIAGNHTYADETTANNPETLTVTVLDLTTLTVAIYGTASVTVADATLSASANNFTAWVNQNTGLIAVATFTDTNSAALASDFSATITWGDNSSSAGTVLATPGGSPGQFTVYGQHTWTSTGNFSVQTTITDDGGQTATVTGTASVVASSAGLNAAEGNQFSGTVANFTANPAWAQSATITWGDGTANSNGTITSTGQNSFKVTGTHTYADEGVFNLSVSVTMSQGPNLSAAGPAVVGDASLSGTANSLSGTVGQLIGPTTIATFTDGNTSATVADFAGTTIDWGDGQITTPTIVATTPAGTFNVVAGHIYLKAGGYTVTTTVRDDGGMTTTLIANAQIGQGFTIGLPEGQVYDPVIKVSLPDPIGTAPPPSYNATIDFGGGGGPGPATATPVYNYTNGSLTGYLLVTANHVYPLGGTYNVTATATNPQTGGSANASVTLSVSDALLNGIPEVIPAVAGVSTGTVTIGQLQDDNPLSLANNFTNITVNWGDGSGNQTGTVVAASTPGLFNIQGTHTYSSAGTDTITITVTDTDGRNVTILSTAIVSSPWTVIGPGTGGLGSDPERGSIIPLDPGGG